MVTWNAWATFHAPGRLFQPPFFYPYSNGVAYQQSAFFTGLLAAIPLSLGLPPVHTVNLLLLASVVTSGTLTYFLAYSLTRRVLPSLLAGVVFAFYPNRLDHIGQFTFQQAFLYPLVVWAWYRFLLDGRWVHVLLVAIALWAQTLSSLYNAFAFAFLLAGLTAAVWLLRPGLFTLSRLFRGGLAASGLALALLPFARPYMAVQREMGFRRVLDEADVFGMDLLSILDPGQFNLFYGGHLVSLGRPEGGLFPGFVALLLAGLAVAFCTRRPADSPRPRSARFAALALVGAAGVALGAIGLAIAVGKMRVVVGGVQVLKFTRLTWYVLLLPVLALGALALEGRRRREGPLDSREWILTAGFLVTFTYVLCLAPTLEVRGESWGTTLFHWIYLYVPGANGFRAPGRWSMVFVLPLALLVALGAQALADRLPRRWRPVVLGMLLVAMLVEYNIKPIPWQTLPSTPAVYRAASGRGWGLRHPPDSHLRTGLGRLGHAVGAGAREAGRQRARGIRARHLERVDRCGRHAGPRPALQQPPEHLPSALCGCASLARGARVGPDGRHDPGGEGGRPHQQGGHRGRRDLPSGRHAPDRSSDPPSLLLGLGPAPSERGIRPDASRGSRGVGPGRSALQRAAPANPSGAGSVPVAA